jgi:aldehyde dehydrogenase (NAD+)
MSIDTGKHEKLAAEVLPKLRLLVDGAWQDRGSGGSTPQVNPSTGRVQGEIPMAGDREIDDAAAAAQAAAGAWRDTTPLDRRILLTELARLVQENKEQLATILTLETGLPSAVTRAFAQRGADFLAYNGSVAETTEGDVIQVDPMHGLHYVLPEPYGVVALIMTWNGGLSALGRKAGAALAAGNTVVIKPSELAPFSAVRFAELALQAGFPPGVINVVHGHGAAGDRLVRSRDVRKVSFTGGISAARRIQASASAAPKPVALELGGKSANIIFPDADVERATTMAATGALYMSGQGCALPTRLLVHSSIHDEVLERVVALAERMAIGDPLLPATLMGPIVSEGHLGRILAMVGRAIDGNAGEICTGGSRHEALRPGAFMQATVLSHVDPNSEIAQQEVFGPVLTVFSFEDDDEAVTMANSTEYGLAASLHTRSLARAHTVSRRLEAGSVAVNGGGGPGSRGGVAMPFGGVKASGYGREGGRAGVQEFISPKSISIGLP